MKRFIKLKKRKLTPTYIVFLIFVFIAITAYNALPHDVTHFWQYNDEGLLVVDACDMEGNRVPNALVDVGYAHRNYIARTNEYGQLVEMNAEKLELQYREEENENGRYCERQANVEGTHRKDYDRGHVIADSLGGVSNAYNITPQYYVVNREGEQVTMEDELRNALYKGKRVTDFHAEIRYPDNDTQIPESYTFTYKINGKEMRHEFVNSYAS